ncbi:MAG: methionine--tRNA ligase subunit beta [Candidatus Omnitrophica bacterium]|nr:methionine--tRNA ligase subunit beta [Candidatus Omnitrophota bacterium]
MVLYEDFKKLDIRVARVIEVKEHPDADKLYVLSIDTGCATKQIVAGLRSEYSAEDLVGKKVIVIDNLESATIRGEESNGMLLAASDDGKPVLLVPERDVPEGSPIS